MAGVVGGVGALEVGGLQGRAYLREVSLAPLADRWVALTLGADRRHGDVLAACDTGMHKSYREKEEASQVLFLM